MDIHSALISSKRPNPKSLTDPLVKMEIVLVLSLPSIAMHGLIPKPQPLNQIPTLSECDLKNEEHAKKMCQCAESVNVLTKKTRLLKVLWTLFLQSTYSICEQAMVQILAGAPQIDRDPPAITLCRTPTLRVLGARSHPFLENFRNSCQTPANSCERSQPDAVMTNLP